MAWAEVDSAATSPAESGIGFDVMTTRVRLNLRNLPSQHPHYSSIGNYINEAVQEFQTLLLGPRFRKKAIDLIPRLKDWRWSDTTVNNQAYMTLPDTLLWMNSVTVTRSSTAFSAATQTEYPVTEEPDGDLFGQNTKTATGYPKKWHRAGSRIELWPTPTTAYLTQLVLHGARAEDTLATTDKLKMPLRLQYFVLELATAISMEKMGWVDASGRRGSIEDRLAKSLDVTSRETARNRVQVQIAGAP